MNKVKTLFGIIWLIILLPILWIASLFGDLEKKK